MNQPAPSNDPELSAQVDMRAGSVSITARNLSETNFRWVIAGIGGGALAIWFLKEVGEFVLRLVELQLRYGG